MACRRSKFIVVVLFAAALAIALAVHGAKAADHKLTLAYVNAKGTTYLTAVELFPETIKAATKGKVEILLSDSLIKGPQLAQSVRDGRVQMSAVVAVYYTAAHPELALATLPGLINTVDQVKAVFDAFWRKDLDQLFLKKYKARVLYWGLHCPQVVISNKPVKTIADFKGLKIRVHNLETGTTVAAIGGKPTPMPISEIVPALQRGIIDADITSFCLAYGRASYTVAPYCQTWHLAPVVLFPIIINNEVFEKLPKDVREEMLKACQKMEQDAFKDYPSDIASLVKKWEAKGGHFYDVPAAESQKIFQKKYIEKVYQSYYDRCRKQGIDGKKYVERALKAMGRTSVY